LPASNSGQFGKELKPYLNRIGNQALVDDAQFKRLLKQAGNDSVMQQTQDAFFDTRYFQPTMHWATEQGFVEALSALVIYDSFIHGGRILSFCGDAFVNQRSWKGATSGNGSPNMSIRGRTGWQIIVIRFCETQFTELNVSRRKSREEIGTCRSCRSMPTA
jgi:hypothetical protein